MCFWLSKSLCALKKLQLKLKTAIVVLCERSFLLGILDNIYHWPDSTDFGEAQDEIEHTILKALKLWEINGDRINFSFNLH